MNVAEFIDRIIPFVCCIAGPCMIIEFVAIHSVVFLCLCNFPGHVLWLASLASGICWTIFALKMPYLETASFQNHCWMMWRKRWKPLLELLPFVLLLCKDPVPGIHQLMTWVVWCLACGVPKVDSKSWSSREFSSFVSTCSSLIQLESWTLFDAGSRVPSGFWCGWQFYPMWANPLDALAKKNSTQCLFSSQNRSTLPVASPISPSIFCRMSTKLRIGARIAPVTLTLCFSSMMLTFRRLCLKNFGKGQRCS